MALSRLWTRSISYIKDEWNIGFWNRISVDLAKGGPSSPLLGCCKLEQFHLKAHPKSLWLDDADALPPSAALQFVW